MSLLVSPVAWKTSWKIGTSISTPLVVLSLCRSFGAWAKPITATSVIWATGERPPPGRRRFHPALDLPSEVMDVGVVRGIRLAGRPEVLDVFRCGAPLLAGLPDRLDSHAHPHLGRLAAQDQVRKRDVRAVDQNRGRDVGRSDLLPAERHVLDAERGHD